MAPRIDTSSTDSSTKLRASRLSITVATLLALLKMVTGFSVNSIAVIAMAIDSVMDILMSAINYIGIRFAAEPADARHPYGHGKFETMAALVQSAIIFAIGIIIGKEAIARLISGEFVMEHLEFGIAVMALSTVISFFLSRYLNRVALKTDSIALKTDALHYSTDVWSNGGVFVALVIMYFLPIPWIDPVISLVVAVYIMKEAVMMLWRVFQELTETALPDELQQEIEAIINDEKALIDFHDLRTRKSGSINVMDLHITVCRFFTIEQAHRIADKVEARIKNGVPNADVVIHIDPCSNNYCDANEHVCNLLGHKQERRARHE